MENVIIIIIIIIIIIVLQDTRPLSLKGKNERKFRC